MTDPEHWTVPDWIGPYEWRDALDADLTHDDLMRLAQAHVIAAGSHSNSQEVVAMILDLAKEMREMEVFRAQQINCIRDAYGKVKEDDG